MTNGFLNLVDVLYKSGEYIEIGGGSICCANGWLVTADYLVLELPIGVARSLGH